MRIRLGWFIANEDLIFLDFLISFNFDCGLPLTVLGCFRLGHGLGDAHSKLFFRRPGNFLALLNDEHEADQDYQLRLLEPLRSIAAGRQPADAVEFGHAARAFSVFQRRHLAWENGTVLPLARKRLSEADQADLGRKMAARRRSPIAD